MTEPIQSPARFAAPDPSRPISPDRTAEMRGVARDLEAAFLEEMLKHAGFGAARESFGGGAGEEQFASLMISEHARAMTAAGGIGLAESIFQSLVAREGATGPSSTSEQER